MSRRSITAWISALVVAVATVSSRPAAAERGAAQQPTTPDLPALLAAASAYVAAFVDRFSNVVSEELYTQDVLPGGSLLAAPRNAPRSDAPATHRVLRSDLLLVKTSDPLGWVSYRDVFEVDGRPVRDRDERLTALFANPVPDALQQAVRISQESARYNIGPTERTLNTPVLALLFLQPGVQPRFRFALAPHTTDVSERAAIVTYEETVRPTIIRTVQDTDRPASGRFWIETDTGQVLQSELVLRGRGVTATFTTVFQPDSHLSIAIPARFREEYQQPSGRLTGVATYSAFRRFNVSTRTNLESEGRPQ